MVQSGRGFRALAAAFKGAGNTLNAYESAKTTRAKEEIEHGRAEERAKRMKALLGGNPEFEGLEDSIDPITGELDPVAMELLKEKFKNKRAEAQADAVASRITAAATLRDTLERRRDKEKLIESLETDPLKRTKYLRGKGLDPNLFGGDSKNPVPIGEIYERILKDEPLPAIRRGKKKKIVPDTANWWEKAFPGTEEVFEINDPLGEYR